MFEDEGSILVGHSNEAGTSWPSIEPENYGIVVRVRLGIKVDVVKVAGGEVEEA